MHLQGAPQQVFYVYETDRCYLDLRVEGKTYRLYATGALAQRLQRQVRKDTSGVVVTLSANDPHEIVAFSIIL